MEAIADSQVQQPAALFLVRRQNSQPASGGAFPGSCAEDVFAWLGFIAPLKSDSVMGFGTIPDCTGCDHGAFIDPGEAIEITFERLGMLRCRFAVPTGKLLPSCWPVREPLQKHHGYRSCPSRYPMDR